MTVVAWVTPKGAHVRMELRADSKATSVTVNNVPIGVHKLATHPTAGLCLTNGSNLWVPVVATIADDVRAMITTRDAAVEAHDKMMREFHGQQDQSGLCPVCHTYCAGECRR